MEELQSVNEELQTVNSELNSKIEEVDRANTDLRNVFDSTQIATVFLDRNLVIRSFTPPVASIFNLISTDRGRPLTDIVSTARFPRRRGVLVFSGRLATRTASCCSRGKRRPAKTSNVQPTRGSVWNWWNAN
jgi:hypothetical protein